MDVVVRAAWRAAAAHRLAVVAGALLERSVRPVHLEGQLVRLAPLVRMALAAVRCHQRDCLVAYQAMVALAVQLAALAVRLEQLAAALAPARNENLAPLSKIGSVIPFLPRGGR